MAEVAGHKGRIRIRYSNGSGKRKEQGAWRKRRHSEKRRKNVDERVSEDEKYIKPYWD